MISTPNCRKLISEFEGLHDRFKSTKIVEAMKDPIGIWTIGYGMTFLKDGSKVTEHTKLTLEECDDLMAWHLRKYEQAINQAVKVPLTQNQFDALTSFVFNVGIGAFQKSTLLKLLNAGDYNGAAGQFLVWVRAGGKVLTGLVRRRAREKELFLK